VLVVPDLQARRASHHGPREALSESAARGARRRTGSLAQVEGDPAKGPSHFFLKFASGFAAPLHHHTANHSGTVVAGTLVLTVAGKEEKLPAGSFFAFSDKTPHMTRCETGAECVLSMDVRGKWDVIVEKDAKK
jgi:quercetin dioxygenase-like cupin family protein